MNVELLRKVQAHILEEPKRVHMDDWFTPVGYLPAERRPACNTVACIAGWAAVLSAPTKHAAEVLVLDGRYFDGEWEPSTFNSPGNPSVNNLGLSDYKQSILFYAYDWPTRFRRELENCEPNTPEYARVVADRIDHFIATNGAE